MGGEGDGGGGGGKGGLVITACKLRESFYAFCIQNLKICIKISNLLLS